MLKPSANRAPRLTPAPARRIRPSGRGDAAGHTAEPGRRPARPAKPAKLSAPIAASDGKGPLRAMRPDVRVGPDSVRLERTMDESTGTYRVLAAPRVPLCISDSCCPTPGGVGHGKRW